VNGYGIPRKKRGVEFKAVHVRTIEYEA